MRCCVRRSSVFRSRRPSPKSPPSPESPAAGSTSARSHSPRSASMADERPRASPIQVPRPERQIAFRTGISAESRAAAFLIAKGFRILARRWRSPVGEIDIIARRRSLLVFVEVKARERLDDAAWSVTDRQRLRIAAAAEAWLARNGDDRIRHIRFDARLGLLGAKVVANVQPLKVRDQQGDHFTLGEARRTELTEFDVVLLRQDPPFDLAYITTTHLLERIQPGTLVVNDPSAVRNAPEKMFVMEFPELMPPTLITRDLAEIKAFRAEYGDIVMKPLYGKGGEALFRPAKEELNFGSLYDLFTVTFREQWVVQKFLPAVKDGDKRILLVDGEFAGAVNRVPAPDDLRSNMARGGTPTETELTARERAICARIGPALREPGHLLSR